MTHPSLIPWTEAEQAEFEEVRRLLLEHRWIFAKTMPENPHEYTLRKTWDDADFLRVVTFIRRCGYRQKFGKSWYTQLDVDDHFYWTMGAPLPMTILINRKRLPA